MKFATIALSTLVAVLAIEPAAVKAESLAQSQPEQATLLAGRHKGRRRIGGFRNRRRIHQRFRNRNFRRFPGRFRHRPFHHNRSRRRLSPRFRHYPYVRYRSPRYYPHYPNSRRLFIHRSFPRRGSYIAPEHVGPEGKYDDQGLAKRVIIGMVGNPELKPLLTTLDVRQQGNRVFLRGEVPNQATLDKVVELAKDMKGAKTVDSSEVIVLSE